MTGARPSPRPLARWREEVASGLRRRPARKPVGSHRPVKPAQLVRDMQIQFTIEVLDRTWNQAEWQFRLRLSHRGRCAGALRRHGDTHLESARPEVPLRARDAEADEGQRRTQRALPYPGGLSLAQARVPPVSLSGSGRSLQISVTRGPPHGHGLLETTGLPAGAFASCAPPDTTHHETP